MLHCVHYQEDHSKSYYVATNGKNGSNLTLCFCASMNDPAKRGLGE